MESVYLLRYGAMGRIVPARPDDDAPAFARGDWAVAATPRGQELAEILAAVGGTHVPDEIPTRILRVATPEDFGRARQHQERAADWLGRCERIVAEVDPALHVVDMEVLLDGKSLVAYVLGDLPDDLPAARAAIRMRHDLDLQLEPLHPEPDTRSPAEGGACGTGGGCGSKGSGESGCAGCGTKQRIASWAAARQA